MKKGTPNVVVSGCPRLNASSTAFEALDAERIEYGLYVLGKIELKR